LKSYSDGERSWIIGARAQGRFVKVNRELVSVPSYKTTDSEWHVIIQDSVDC
jgi:hypothetical protein